MTSAQRTAAPDRIRVAVIDDHPLFREGVAHTIRSAKGLQVVAEGGCAEDAVRIAQDKLPDIILDVSMPGGGIEAARVIGRICPAVKMIMLTVSECEEHVSRALAAGAQGYVLKGTSALELVDTLRAVWRGEAYVSPALAARLLTGVEHPAGAVADSTLSELTKREQNILDLVGHGLLNREIAQGLGIGEKTVKHHMTNIMQKLHVRNRVEAVLVSQRNTQAETRRHLTGPGRMRVFVDHPSMRLCRPHLGTWISRTRRLSQGAAST